MTSGGAAGAPLGKPGPAGMKHRPGGAVVGARGSPRLVLGPLFPCRRSPGYPMRIVRQPWRAWPRERALRTGMLLLTHHLSMKPLNFFFIFLIKNKTKRFFF